MAHRASTRSRGKLVDAATSLLDERDPSEVTITDVVARAGVTRPTFYSAFGDLPTIFAEAAAVRLAAAFTGTALPDVPAEERQEAMRQVILRILQRVEPHAEFFRRVLLGHGGHLVQLRIIDLVAGELRENTPVSGALARGPLPLDTASAAIAAGISWAMLRWFASAERTPIETLAETLRDLVFHTVIGGLGADDSTERTLH